MPCIFKTGRQLELLSLMGDIAVKDGESQVHAHVVVGRSDGTAHAGHLLETAGRRLYRRCKVNMNETVQHYG